MAKSKRNERIPFTKEEIEIIKKTPDRNLKDVAFALGRSYDAVRRKKWLLLNKKRDVQAKLEYKERVYKASQKDAKYTNTRWSIAEEQFVLESKLPDIEIAKELKRSVSSIQVKRHRLLQEKKNAGKRKPKPSK